MLQWRCSASGQQGVGLQLHNMQNCLCIMDLDDYGRKRLQNMLVKSGWCFVLVCKAFLVSIADSS